MSVFDLPRIHFRGLCRVHAPTVQADRFPLVDLAAQQVYWDGQRVLPNVEPVAFHERLLTETLRYDAAGQLNERGPFSLATGWDFGGNGHLSWEETRVSAVELALGEFAEDPLLGSSLDLWGHHNPVLGTTVNRARLLRGDLTDPATTMVLAGQFALGRRAASVQHPYALLADLDGYQVARWVNPQRNAAPFDHAMREALSTSFVFQFVIPAARCRWADTPPGSVLKRLERLLTNGQFGGLVVQYTIFNMGHPVAPNSPYFYELMGTLAPWRASEAVSLPAGRHLRSVSSAFGAASVGFAADRVDWNLMGALPYQCAQPQLADGRRTPELGALQDLGTLTLRTASAKTLLAQLPAQLYASSLYWQSSGLLASQLLAPSVPDEPLELVTTTAPGQEIVLAREEELLCESDPAYLWLEHRHPERPGVTDKTARLRFFQRGKPAHEVPLCLQSQLNPAGFSLAAAREKAAGTTPVLFATRAAGAFNPAHTCQTDADGYVALQLRGVASGVGRILITPNAALLPGNDLPLFQQPTASPYFRVLPNDWALEKVTDEQVDFPFLYANVLHYYELLYPFMRDAVFSLQDECKCETYARLMWQMCDPEYQDKTFYMPPTRDLSLPKSRLFLAYLKNVQRVRYVETVSCAAAAVTTASGFATRAELVEAVSTAVSVELSIMLQYLYAAFTLPNHKSGCEYVRRGDWTAEQLRLVAGDGQEKRDYGWRGLLLHIAHEEMIHYLVANNLLMSLGEGFHHGLGEDFAPRLALGLDLHSAFEPFSGTALERFLHFETPSFVDPRLAGNRTQLRDLTSVGELYLTIRQSFVDHPEWITVGPGQAGGEHHLFLARRTDQKHPDYQLQVYDQPSALHAIDNLMEQGEGLSLDSPSFADSHFQHFRRCAAAWGAQQTRRPWFPAYPALTNPRLCANQPGMVEVTGKAARAVLELFNECFWISMQLMSEHFTHNAAGSLRRSRLMNASIDFMTGLMRPLGEVLVTMPSGVKGKTAGPSFELPRPLTRFESYEDGCQAMAAHCLRLRAQAAALTPWVGRAERELLEFYTNMFTELAAGRLSRFA
jgi:hypothetical protein